MLVASLHACRSHIACVDGPRSRALNNGSEKDSIHVNRKGRGGREKRKGGNLFCCDFSFRNNPGWSMWIKNYAKTDFDPLTPPILKGTIESVPTQLAHRAGSMGWPFPVLKYKYILHSKTVMVLCYLYCNFRHAFVPCWHLKSTSRLLSQIRGARPRYIFPHFLHAVP